MKWEELYKIYWLCYFPDNSLSQISSNSDFFLPIFIFSNKIMFSSLKFYFTKFPSALLKKYFVNILSIFIIQFNFSDIFLLCRNKHSYMVISVNYWCITRYLETHLVKTNNHLLFFQFLILVRWFFSFLLGLFIWL